MVKQYFVTLLFILSTFGVQAQDKSVIDSLKSIIETGKHDTAICNAYLIWGEEVYLNKPDTAFILWKKAHTLAQEKLSIGLPNSLIKKRYLYCYAESLNNIGYIHSRRGNLTKALEFYYKSLKINVEISNSPDPSTAQSGKRSVAASLNNIGSAYKNQGNIPKGLEYYNKSLIIREEIEDKSGIAISLNNIGLIYSNQGDVAKALEYYHKSLLIHEEIGEKNGLAASLNNIGYIYHNQGDAVKALEYFHKCLMLLEEIGTKRGIASSLNNIGTVYDDQGDIPKALEYHHKSLRIREKIGYKSGIANSLNNIGYIYKNQGTASTESSTKVEHFTKALECFHKSLIIRKEIGEKRGIATSLNNIGDIELEQGRLVSALNYGTRGLEIAREIGSPDHISTSSGLLSNVAKEQGDFKQALMMYELHIQMRDSIKNEQTQKATIRQQTKYEFEKAQLIKEQEEQEAARLEAEVMSRRDNLQYSVILIAILVLFGGVLSLGFVNVSARMAEGIIFFSFLILFEFFLVLADPYIDKWSGGAPGFKLLFNAGIAALIFPMHSFFESRLKARLVKNRT